eukprot:g2781.t1
MVLFTEIIVGNLIKFSVAYYYRHYVDEFCEPTEPRTRRWYLVVCFLEPRDAVSLLIAAGRGTSSSTTAVPEKLERSMDVFTPPKPNLPEHSLTTAAGGGHGGFAAASAAVLGYAVDTKGVSVAVRYALRHGAGVFRAYRIAGMRSAQIGSFLASADSLQRQLLAMGQHEHEAMQNVGVQELPAAAHCHNSHACDGVDDKAGTPFEQALRRRVLQRLQSCDACGRAIIGVPHHGVGENVEAQNETYESKPASTRAQVNVEKELMTLLASIHVVHHVEQARSGSAEDQRVWRLLIVLRDVVLEFYQHTFTCVCDTSGDTAQEMPRHACVGQLALVDRDSCDPQETSIVQGAEQMLDDADRWARKLVDGTARHITLEEEVRDAEERRAEAVAALEATTAAVVGASDGVQYRDRSLDKVEATLAPLFTPVELRDLDARAVLMQQHASVAKLGIVLRAQARLRARARRRRFKLHGWQLLGCRAQSRNGDYGEENEDDGGEVDGLHKQDLGGVSVNENNRGNNARNMGQDGKSANFLRVAARKVSQAAVALAEPLSPFSPGHAGLGIHHAATHGAAPPEQASFDDTTSVHDGVASSGRTADADSANSCDDVIEDFLVAFNQRVKGVKKIAGNANDASASTDPAIDMHAKNNIGNVGVFELAQDDDDEEGEDEEDDDDEDEEEEDDDSKGANEIEELFGRDKYTAKDRANIKAAQCGRPLELHAQATAAAARIACRAAESARAAAGAASAAATDAAADAVSRAVLQEAKRAAVAEQQREHADKLSLRRHQSLHPSARLVDGPMDSASASTAVIDVEVKTAGKDGDTCETEDDDANIDKCTERRGSIIQTIVPAAEATMHATVAGWSAYNSTLARVIGRDELAANLADNARCHATTAALRMKSVAEARSRSFSGDIGDEAAEDNSLNLKSPMSNASEHEVCATSAPAGDTAPQRGQKQHDEKLSSPPPPPQPHPRQQVSNQQQRSALTLTRGMSFDPRLVHEGATTTLRRVHYVPLEQRLGEAAAAVTSPNSLSSVLMTAEKSGIAGNGSAVRVRRWSSLGPYLASMKDSGDRGTDAQAGVASSSCRKAGSVRASVAHAGGTPVDTATEESVAAVKEERTLTLMSAAAGLPAAAGAIPLIYFNRNTMPRPGEFTSVDNTHDGSIAGTFQDMDAFGAKADGKIDTESSSSQPTSKSTQVEGAIPTTTAINPKDICDQDIAATPVRMGRGEWALALGTLRQRLKLSASVSDARLRVFMSALCHDPEVPMRYIEEPLGLE